MVSTPDNVRICFMVSTLTPALDCGCARCCYGFHSGPCSGQCLDNVRIYSMLLWFPGPCSGQCLVLPAPLKCGDMLVLLWFSLETPAPDNVGMCTAPDNVGMCTAPDNVGMCTKPLLLTMWGCALLLTMWGCALNLCS